MNAARLFGKALTNVFIISDRYAHHIHEVRLDLCAQVRLGLLRTRKIESRRGGHTDNSAAFTDRAFNQSFANLRTRILFGGKSSFEAMIVFTSKAIDFHQETDRELEN